MTRKLETMEQGLFDQYTANILKDESEPQEVLKAYVEAITPDNVMLTYRGLPKWPQLRIVGALVTVEQAKDIIFRTDTKLTYFGHTNDQAWGDFVEKTVFDYGKEPEWHFDLDGNDKRTEEDRAKERDARHAYWEAREAFQKRHKRIETTYVHNTWIASSYIGGPYGWCSPAGRIFYEDNIGKWPSIEEVFKDLIKIAQAFPYVKLAAVLMSGEHNDEEEISPVVGFRVADGAVTLVNTDETDPLAEFGGFTNRNQQAWIENAVAGLGRGGSERGVPREWIIEWGERNRASLEGHSDSPTLSKE